MTASQTPSGVICVYGIAGRPASSGKTMPISTRNLPAVTISSPGTRRAQSCSVRFPPSSSTPSTATATQIQSGWVNATGPITYARTLQTGTMKPRSAGSEAANWPRRYA